jgi:Domain of unknown function (DUF6249)
MDERVVAVFIPIILFLVSGLVAVVYLYLRSKERQMLIEKNLDAEAIKEFFNNKKNYDPYRLFKFGVICVFFGLGLGIGMMLEDYTRADYWVPFALFTITGLGFIVANLSARKMDQKKIQ